MTLDKCTNPEVGRLLHAYELNTLDDDQVNRFEAHMLNCDYCFEELRRFDTEAHLLFDNPEIRSLVRPAPVREAESPIANLWRRLLSPEIPFLLRPIALIVVIMILVYPAYMGIMHRENDSASLYPIGLSALRSTSVDSYAIPPGDDVALSLACPACDIGAGYALSIIQETGRVVYDNPHFAGFDKYGVGRLYLPRKLLGTGLYTVTVSSETDTSSLVVYQFRITKSP